MDQNLIELINSSFSTGFLSGDSTFRKVDSEREHISPRNELLTFSRPGASGKVHDDNKPLRHDLERGNYKRSLHPTSYDDKKMGRYENYLPRKKQKHSRSHTTHMHDNDYSLKTFKSKSRTMYEATSSVGEDELQFKINSSMLQFLEIGMKHKKDRAEEKKKFQEQEQNVVYVDVSEVPYGSASGRQYWREKERRDRYHSRDMEEQIKKYGKEYAPEISGIEMTMQLNFERNCQKTKPALWPIVPLNMESFASTGRQETKTFIV